MTSPIVTVPKLVIIAEAGAAHGGSLIVQPPASGEPAPTQ
jgi:cephalosporin hydroxylase